MVNWCQYVSNLISYSKLCGSGSVFGIQIGIQKVALTTGTYGSPIWIRIQNTDSNPIKGKLLVVRVG